MRTRKICFWNLLTFSVNMMDVFMFPQSTGLHRLHTQAVIIHLFPQTTRILRLHTQAVIIHRDIKDNSNKIVGICLCELPFLYTTVCIQNMISSWYNFLLSELTLLLAPEIYIYSRVQKSIENCSVWSKMALEEVGVSLSWWCHALVLPTPGYWGLFYTSKFFPNGKMTSFRNILGQSWKS